MDAETIVKNIMLSIVAGFLITLFFGITYISMGSQSSYIHEGGVPLTWIEEVEYFGVTDYDYTGFILDLIFWSCIFFLIGSSIQKTRLETEPKTSQPSEDSEPETLREKQLKLVQKIQEQRQVEKLVEESKRMEKEGKKK